MDMKTILGCGWAHLRLPMKPCGIVGAFFNVLSLKRPGKPPINRRGAFLWVKMWYYKKGHDEQ